MNEAVPQKTLNGLPIFILFKAGSNFGFQSFTQVIIVIN